MKTSKYSSWPHFEEDEINIVKKILSSGKVNSWTGNETKNFEIEFASNLQIKHAIALSNGSNALTAAYMAIGITYGDEIITSPRTFIATASTAALLGAKPVFADVDIDSGAIYADSIEKLITPKTKAISVVHLGGWPADMNPIIGLAKAYGIYVIEDCSQAHGARINGQNVGTFGDISTWSFCQDKIISTGGEGGMVATNSNYFYKNIWSIKDHGKNLEKISLKTNSLDFRWLHDSLGTNMRLTEMQSAIGRIQLRKLNQWNRLRARNAMIFFNELCKLNSLRIPIPSRELTHAWYRFYTYIELDSISDDWDRNRILSELNKNGVPAFSGSCGELYLEKCFKNESETFSRLEVAFKLSQSSLCFLVHPNLKEEEIYEQASIIKDVISKAEK